MLYGHYLVVFYVPCVDGTVERRKIKKKKNRSLFKRSFKLTYFLASIAKKISQNNIVFKLYSKLKLNYT